MLAVNTIGDARTINAVADIMERLGEFAPTLRNGVAPFAGGELPFSAVPDAFLTSQLDRKGVDFFISFLDVVGELPMIKRLEGIRQNPSSFFTSLARNVDGDVVPGMYDHTRAEHSRDVAGLAILAAFKGNFTGEQALISMLVGYFHDAGHAVFAHTGEEIIHEMGLESFNHDLFTVILASQPEIGKFCADWGINHKDLVACLGGQELLDKYDDLKKLQQDLAKLEVPLVLDLVLDLESENASVDQTRIRKWATFNELVQVDLDMLAYIVRDLHHTEVPDERKEKIAALVFETMNAIDIDSDGHLSISGLSTYSRLLRAFADQSQERSLSGRAGVFKSVARGALKRGGITVTDLIVGQEDPIVEMFESEDKEKLLKGTDRYSGIVLSVQPTARSGSGNHALEEALTTREMIALRKTIQGRLEQDQDLQKLLDGREILVSTTAPLRKVRDFALRGEALEEARRRDYEGYMIDNKYHDDLVIVTSGLVEKGGKVFGRFGCYAIESFMISLERRDHERRDLKVPVSNEDDIKSSATRIIMAVLEESLLDKKFACEGPPVDRLGKGSNRYLN